MASNSDLPDSVWRLLRPTGLAGLGVFVSALAGCSRQVALDVKTPTPKIATRVVAQAEAIPTSTLGDYSDLATRCVALDETTPTDTARLGIVPSTDGQQPASKTKKPVVSAARAPAPPAKKVAQKVEKVETRVAARQSRPTVRLADPAPVQEPAVQEPPKVEKTVAAPMAPAVAPEPAPVVPSPPPPVLSPAPALSIALSNAPAPRKTPKAPVLRMAKGRTAPAPEAVAPAVETPVPTPEPATTPAVAAAPTQESTVPSVEAAPVAEPVVAKPTAPSAVALSEADSAETKNAAPAREVAVPPRQTPAVAKTPAAASWQPFTQRVEHWPQPVAPSVRERDTVDDVVTGELSPARVPQTDSLSGAAAPAKAAMPVAAPSQVGAKGQDLPKAPAVVSAPPRPAVSVAQAPAAQPSEEAMGSRRSAAPAPVIAPKRVAERNVPAGPVPSPAAELPLSQPPARQPVVQSRPVANQTPPVRVAAARPPIAPTTSTAAETSQQLAMISNRAGEHIEYAFNLAERGALYSAEAEFTQGLVLIAQALDAEHRTQAHSTAVAAGLRALHEADDFIPRGGQTLVRVEEVVSSHKTPVWNNVRPEQVPPLVAMQRYYAYAQQQFTISGTSVPAAAMALYGLGRLQSALSAEDSVKKMTAGPKAMALYRATLDIDPNNYLAANELGVLYGRYGQLNDAEASLRRSIAIAPRPENWHNLADVLERMGNSAGATEARQQEQLAKSSGNRPGWQTSADRVPLRYVDPETFMKASAGVDPDQLATAEPAKTGGEGTAAPAAPAAEPKTAKKSYGWFGDKLAEGAARVSRPAKADPEIVR